MEKDIQKISHQVKLKVWYDPVLLTQTVSEADMAEFGFIELASYKVSIPFATSPTKLEVQEYQERYKKQKEQSEKQTISVEKQEEGK